jgi:transcription-repair coupling factor (superfamily II helicase)
MGSELYGHLLSRAIATLRGGHVPPEWTPEIAFEIAAFIPEAMVPEPDLRLELYRRLARLATQRGIDDFAEELEDRFGDLPPPALNLLGLARLRIACGALGIASVRAGPAGIALTPRPEADAERLTARLAERVNAHWSRDRLILDIAEPRAEERLERLLDVLRQDTTG